MRDSHEESLKRLQHIKQAIADIQEYVKEEDVLSFSNSNLLQDAVLFQFTIIGEAIIYVETEKLDKYGYPWHKVRGFRNMIAHEYFNIKMDAVWEVIEKDLPELKKVIAQILKNEF